MDWQPMTTAPKDGRALEVQVSGSDSLGHGYRHALPYRVRYFNGCWRYVRYDTPVFYWHKPMRWRTA